MTFTEIFQIIYKTILCYFFILFCLKIMGKREIGEISAFDIVVFFIISELFSLSLNEPEHSILRSIIPVSIIVLLQLVTALISLYVPKFRSLMEGKKSYLIYKGVIQQNEMKRQRYTIEDLMAQLRMKEIQTPQDVEYAILENNGELTIIKKDNCIMLSPDPLIMDGKINKTALARITKDEVWLVEELKKLGFIDVSKLFLVLYLKNGLYIVPFKKGDNINKVK
ncbi:putative uncharacterized protein [Firmicutes bacterium CAG:345]|nr:putative uncharacterized protein [Firmicutes bacterium CAG:345]